MTKGRVHNGFLREERISLDGLNFSFFFMAGFEWSFSWRLVMNKVFFLYCLDSINDRL